jgi:hypothetical protein
MGNTNQPNKHKHLLTQHLVNLLKQFQNAMEYKT